MKHLFLILALLCATAATAQSTKTNTNRPAAQAATKKTTPTQRTNPAAKNPVAANNAVIKKAVNSNPQYKEVSFSISGKAHGFPEGEWVKLCLPGKNGLEATDSVQLANENFAFSGKTLNVPYMQYLVAGQDNNKTIVEIFVEEGSIKADITAGKRNANISGTTHNDIFTPYRDSINVFYDGIFRCTRETMRLTNSEEDREAYKLGADSLRQEIVNYTYTFARKNLNNWVGVYLFAEYYKRFTPAQNKALLAAVPSKYANLPIIGEIRKFVRTQK